MSIETDIAAAPNQRDALLVLGRALDRIEELIAHPPMLVATADTWDTWEAAPTVRAAGTSAPKELQGLKNIVDTSAQEATLRAKVADAERRLAAASDPEDVQAITAELRLLRDTGQSMGEYVPQGDRTGVSSDGTTGDVVLKAVDVQRQADRHGWALAARLGEFIDMDNLAAAEVFAKGGPMWLYLGNRDAVMQLAIGHRQWLVNEIELDSPAQAQEVGRDILKSEDPVDKDIAIHAINAISEANVG